VNHSEQINELATALAKAQATIRCAVRERVNPHFKSKYADLAGVWDACRESLSANGLAVSQGVATNESGVVVTTLLMHSSGQWISEQLIVPMDKRNAHGVGSAATYARRFGLGAMVGVAPDDEDDDGNGAGPACLTDADQLYIADANKAMGDAKTLAELDTIAAEFKNKSDVIRAELKPMYMARRAALTPKEAK
jgi:hypothetical protein